MEPYKNPDQKNFMEKFYFEIFDLKIKPRIFKTFQNTVLLLPFFFENPGFNFQKVPWFFEAKENTG